MLFLPVPWFQPLTDEGRPGREDRERAGSGRPCTQVQRVGARSTLPAPKDKPNTSLRGVPSQNTECFSRMQQESRIAVREKLAAVLDMRGAWFAICVSTQAHPKQKEIFPHRSQSGCGRERRKRDKAKGAEIRARSTEGSGDL